MRVFMLLCLAVLISSCHQKPSYRQVRFDGNVAVVDVHSLKEGVPDFYSAVFEGRKIDFFIIAENRVVKAYFDACKECYFKKMGYRYEKGELVCRACNVRFPIDKLDTGIGGCYPIKVPGTRKDDKYIIQKEALEAGLKFF
jgi:uncharacterized membrane protein